MPILAPDDDGKKALETFHGHLAEFGRKLEDVGMEAWLRFTENDPQAWAAAADGWRGMGADMAMLYQMWRDESVTAQIEILRRFKEVAEG